MKYFSNVMSRITAAATAFVLITGTASCANNNDNNIEFKSQPYYMSNAKDYKQVYTILKESAQKHDFERIRRNTDYDDDDIDIVYEAEHSDLSDDEDAGSEEYSYLSGASYSSPMGVPFTDSILPLDPAKKTDPGNNYQENDVFSYDIIKTDGKHICYLDDYYDEKKNKHSFLRVIDVENGKFLGYREVDLKKDICDDDDNKSIDAWQMFIYNNMIAVIGSVSIGNSYVNDEHFSFVAFYTTDDTPKLIDVYKQSGYSGYPRITTDGYLIIPTSYSSLKSTDIESSKDIGNYIPYYGLNGDYSPVRPEDILLPEEITASEKLKYWIIGSIDLNNTGSPKICDIKALAGCSWCDYISEENIYAKSYSWDKGGKTDLTRISFKNGIIAPAAGCTIDGSVNHSGFFYETNGYLCIAANYAEYDKVFHKYSDNEEIKEYLYDRLEGSGDDGFYTYKGKNKSARFHILDMDMNIVGSINNIENEESIYNVDFVNDMALVSPSHRQDKIYAIDLSSPENPTVLDNLKIKGYSSYMQSWDENSIICLGESTNKDNYVIGVRLTMFDSSDQKELKTADICKWDDQRIDASTWDPNKENPEEIYSTSHLSPLIIAPEKNIICIPLTHEYYLSTENCITYKANMNEYVFYSFENGKFVQKGDIKSPKEDLRDLGKNPRYDRALYIGDYIYMLSNKKIIAADLNTIQITDELNF